MDKTFKEALAEYFTAAELVEFLEISVEDIIEIFEEDIMDFEEELKDEIQYNIDSDEEFND